MQFQTRINEFTIAEVEDRRIAFRVGVNIGDVIVEPHDIFGDGVNIAARLESIAEPAGSASRLLPTIKSEEGRGRVRRLGEQNLKNIARPVRAYAAVKDDPGPTAKSWSTIKPTFTASLSIVVLPFANLSADPEQDYFVDGVTESLTTDCRASGVRS